MNHELLFVPTTADAWSTALSAAQVEGFVANDALRSTFDIADGDDEGAEHAAMLVASVAGLIRHGQRFVLACQVDRTALTCEFDHPETLNGRVLCKPLSRSQVLSFFTDDESPRAVAAAAAAATRGLGIDEAWQTEELAALVAEHELLWHAAEELPEHPEELPADPEEQPDDQGGH